MIGVAWVSWLTCYTNNILELLGFALEAYIPIGAQTGEGYFHTIMLVQISLQVYNSAHELPCTYNVKVCLNGD